MVFNIISLKTLFLGTEIFISIIHKSVTLIQVPHRTLPRLRNGLNLEQDLVPVGHPVWNGLNLENNCSSSGAPSLEWVGNLALAKKTSVEFIVSIIDCFSFCIQQFFVLFFFLVFFRIKKF